MTTFHDPNLDDPPAGLSKEELEEYQRESEEIRVERERTAERIRRGEALQKEIEAARANVDRDGDGLPSGRYQYKGGKFVRVGDVEPLVRYHGAVLPPGTQIDEFKPTPGNWESENRSSIGSIPAIYTTSDPEAALKYGQGYNLKYGQGGMDWERNIYEVVITPNETVNLGKCKDDEIAKQAIIQGFDVIECPDFWEQPETIVFDPKKVEVEATYPVSLHQDRNAPLVDAQYNTGNEKLDRLIQSGDVGLPAIPIRGRRMDKVKEAIADMEAAKGTDRYKSQSSPTKSAEYRTTAQKNPSFVTPKKRGRGLIGMFNR